MNEQKEKKLVNKVEDYLIHEFGRYLDSIGAKTIMGRIWGLLLARGEPVSLKEMAEKLNLSKASVSNYAGIGAYLGVFRKTYNPDLPRENFYEIRFEDAMDMMIDPGIKKLSSLADKFEKSGKKIESFPDFEESESLKELHTRMTHMKAIFDIVIEEYEKFGDKIRKRMEKLKKYHNNSEDL